MAVRFRGTSTTKIFTDTPYCVGDVDFLETLCIVESSVWNLLERLRDSHYRCSCQVPFSLRKSSQ